MPMLNSTCKSGNSRFVTIRSFQIYVLIMNMTEDSVEAFLLSTTKEMVKLCKSSLNIQVEDKNVELQVSVSRSVSGDPLLT